MYQNVFSHEEKNCKISIARNKTESEYIYYNKTTLQNLSMTQQDISVSQNPGHVLITKCSYCGVTLSTENDTDKA